MPAPPDPPRGYPWLADLPREEWRAALEQVPSHLQRFAWGNSGLSTFEDLSEVQQLLGIILVENTFRRSDAGPRSSVLPAPDLPPLAGPEPRRQVNVRLGDGDHARLQRAASRNAMRPTALARLLIVRGVNSLLVEPGE